MFRRLTDSIGGLFGRQRRPDPPPNRELDRMQNQIFQANPAFRRGRDDQQVRQIAGQALEGRERAREITARNRSLLEEQGDRLSQAAELERQDRREREANERALAEQAEQERLTRQRQAALLQRQAEERAAVAAREENPKPPVYTSTREPAEDPYIARRPAGPRPSGVVDRRRPMGPAPDRRNPR
jgi:hypothetical protein